MSGAEVFGLCFLVFFLGFCAAWVCWMGVYERHDWGKWKEMRPLTIYIRDKFGGQNEENYRRFERECKDCGIVEIKKVRID